MRIVLRSYCPTTALSLNAPDLIMGDSPRVASLCGAESWILELNSLESPFAKSSGPIDLLVRMVAIDTIDHVELARPL